MDELTKFLNGGITSFRRAAAVNGIVNGTYNIEGAGDERIQLDDTTSVSDPTDDDRFVARSTPGLGGINPLYIVGGAIVAVLLLRK